MQGRDRERYSPGEVGDIRLTNLLAATIGHDLCVLTLEQLAHGARVEAPGQDDRVRTMELRRLQTGGTTTFPLELPEELASGEYRFVTTTELMDRGARQEIATSVSAAANQPPPQTGCRSTVVR